MKRFLGSLLCLATIFTLVCQNDVEARVGTWDVGPGAKAKGMGGCAVAVPQDSYIGAINPAGAVWVEDRYDIGLQVLSAPRYYTWSKALAGGVVPLQPFHGKKRGYLQVLLLPEAGYNYNIDECSAFNATFYIGGGQTEYKQTNPIAAGNAQDQLSHRSGINLGQYFAALSYSRWITPCHSLGVALVLVEQTLTVRGFHGFDNPVLSVAPGSVTNRNIDYSFGAGFRFGWIGRICDSVTAAASYTTRMACERFKKYKGVVPQKGRLEVPAILAVGLTWDWACYSRICFEWQRLYYGDCQLWHNSFQRYIGAGGTFKSGANNGPGFGWDNLDVYKVGIDYQYDECVTLRGGWVVSQIPYNNRQLDVNIATMNIGKNHLTLGFTYVIDSCSELDFSYFHMFPVNYSGPSQLINNLGTLTQHMYMDSFELSYGVRF